MLLARACDVMMRLPVRRAEGEIERRDRIAAALDQRPKERIVDVISLAVHARRQRDIGR
jgi:hypothetical protein